MARYPDALSRFIESYIDQASLQTATPLHRVMAAKAIVTFQHGSMGQQRVASLLLDDQLWSQRGVNYKNISSVFKIVESDLKDADLVNAFKQKIQERYPRSELFNAVGTPIYKGVLDLETTE